MKKTLLFTLAILLLLVLAVSCGTNETTESQTESSTESEAASMNSEESSTEATTAEVTTTAPVTTEETPTTYSLEGKTMIFLGSSVTYGSNAGGYSMADALRDQYHINLIKEAVSGTTLVDNDGGSYVSRMKNNLDKNVHVDHVVVQLSTNDATQNKPLGKLSDSKDPATFNTKTVIGAIEYIIWYCEETWHCPVSFYTGTKFDNANYEKMVNALYDIQEKWGIGIIDLWNDPAMNAVPPSLYHMYMTDDIHPSKIGYTRWWLPKFVEHLQKYE